MALIFEKFTDSAKGKKISIPKKTSDTLGAYKDGMEAQLGKGQDLNMLPGGGVLKKWSGKKHYNERGSNKKKNGTEMNSTPSITPNDANVFLTRQKKSLAKYGVKSPKNTIYASKAGNIMKQTAEKIVAAGRREGQKVQAVKPVKPNAQNDTKPANVSTKTISMPKGDIKVQVTAENRLIKEDNDRHIFYEYLEDYGESYVFNEFLSNPNGKENWGVLINPSMYKKALSMFTKYGNLATFPEKYVYQWMGIIMKNTAILIANTNIAGHSRYFPMDDFEDFLYSYFKNRDITIDDEYVIIEITPQDVVKMCNDETIVENIVDRHGQTYLPFVSHGEMQRITHKQDVDRMKDSLGDIAEYIAQYNEENWDKIQIDEKTGKLVWKIEHLSLIDKIGMYDWMQAPDGSDAWSDFGIDPILNIIKEYDENLPPEKVLVLVNKVLDVYHCRGDLSSMFITGGKSSLNKIAEEKERNTKKIMIDESKLLLLKLYGE